MAWEQDISEKLQEAQDIAVRFDVQQDLTEAEKSRARNNIDIKTMATQISGEDYKIVFNY